MDREHAEDGRVAERASEAAPAERRERTGAVMNGPGSMMLPEGAVPVARRT